MFGDILLTVSTTASLLTVYLARATLVDERASRRERAHFDEIDRLQHLMVAFGDADTSNEAWFGAQISVKLQRAAIGYVKLPAVEAFEDAPAIYNENLRAAALAEIAVAIAERGVAISRSSAKTRCWLFRRIASMRGPNLRRGR